jgi:hypothetical protein
MANGTVLMDPSIRRSALLGRQAAMKHVRGSVTLLLLPFPYILSRAPKLLIS